MQAEPPAARFIHPERQQATLVLELLRLPSGALLVGTAAVELGATGRAARRSKLARCQFCGRCPRARQREVIWMAAAAAAAAAVVRGLPAPKQMQVPQHGSRSRSSSENNSNRAT